jgi:hypothetical protein
MLGFVHVILVRDNRKLLENSWFNRVGMKKGKSKVRPVMQYEGIKVYIDGWGSVPQKLGTEPPVYSWIHSTTTGNTVRIVIRVRPQYRCYLSSF